MGIPVIESYPGAAQDIMRIPRKRASLEYLKQGLGEFGISGSFLDTSVSHDEVDAITSAVVGLFFWGGKFEALGNDDEEYLIIPDLLAAPDPWRQRLVVGFSGPIASGKTTGAKFLERKSFAYGRYSQVLATLLASDGIKPTRANLQKIGDRIHRKQGQRWLSRQLILGLSRDRNLSIDGLRFPEDHAFLVESFGPAFLHLHVTALEAMREKRYIKAGGTAPAFKRAIRHPVESKILRLATIAHDSLKNEQSISEYEQDVLRVVERVRRSRGGS
jgi:dephospho-CoA kinase